MDWFFLIISTFPTVKPQRGHTSASRHHALHHDAAASCRGNCAVKSPLDSRCNHPPSKDGNTSCQQHLQRTHGPSQLIDGCWYSCAADVHPQPRLRCARNHSRTHPWPQHRGKGGGYLDHQPSTPQLTTQADADGFYTYMRPEGKSGGHGVGWSEVPRYSFKVPAGWEETPVSIADLGGTEVRTPIVNTVTSAAQQLSWCT